MGITASVLFAGIALLSYRLPILPGINSVGRKSFGTCFYAVSFGLIMAAFWPIHQPYYGVIGILTMSWGDGLAALIGQRFGRHSYQVLNQTKSWEGSLTMLLVSFMLTAGVLISIQGAIWQTWAVAGMVALVATSLETISQFGIDNLTVPLTAAMVAFGLNSLWQ
jgi:phytol kinase